MEIPFPDGKRVSFGVERCRYNSSGEKVETCVIKDAGDDPDVTNRALICATVWLFEKKDGDKSDVILIKGGKGVGIVTKAGLPVAVGKPAINPIPLQMIADAVGEVLSHYPLSPKQRVCVEISVPDGEVLAKKTLNARLGIIGGISILGTTGIVRPVSAAAWTATIRISMNVACSAGEREIVLSTGRTSERCVQQMFHFSEESLVMMGDYLHFSLRESKKYQFRKIHIATMWAKLLKGAMKIPQTHVRHGALEITNVLEFFKDIGVDNATIETLRDANTAREILDRLIKTGEKELVLSVCKKAKEYYTEISQNEIAIHLVDGTGKLLCSM